MFPEGTYNKDVQHFKKVEFSTLSCSMKALRHNRNFEYSSFDLEDLMRYSISVRDLVEEYQWQPMYKTIAISFSKPVGNHA